MEKKKTALSHWRGVFLSDIFFFFFLYTSFQIHSFFYDPHTRLGYLDCHLQRAMHDIYDEGFGGRHSLKVKHDRCKVPPFPSEAIKTLLAEKKKFTRNLNLNMLAKVEVRSRGDVLLNARAFCMIRQASRGSLVGFEAEGLRICFSLQSPWVTYGVFFFGGSRCGVLVFFVFVESIHVGT